MARGIAGEKFDIVKKWGINTYKVGFKHFSLFPHFPWVPLPHIPDSTIPSMAETRSVGMLGSIPVGGRGKVLGSLTYSPTSQSVHKAAVIRAIWPRLPDCGPGAGAAD